MMSTTPNISTDGGGAAAKIREWSSLIGIVTAIVGNILISFALNIQRYAHILLDSEQEAQNEQWDRLHRKSGQRSYGTQQSDIAEERLRFNLEAPSEDERRSKGQNVDGDTSSGNKKSDDAESLRSFSSSDSTIKASDKPGPRPNRKTYLRSPYWWAGIVLMTMGEAGNFLAYGFAPASIVSPLGVVALVSNCIIAPLVLKERFRQRDFWGVVVAIAGAVTIVLSAQTSEKKMGPDDVWEAITRWEFETYLGITAAMAVVLVWASSKYGDKSVLIDLGLVGLFGGYTALSTKGVASLLSDTLWRSLTFPITYLLVFVLVTTALLQIRYVNRALQRFDSTQVIPIQFVLFTISVIIGSAVLYRDFQSADASRFGKFFGGCALTFLGVYLITSGRERESEKDNVDDIGEEENVVGLVDEERYQDDVSVDGHSNRDGGKSSTISANLDGRSQSRGRKESLGPKSKQQVSPPPMPSDSLSHSSSISSRISHSSQDLESPLLENPWQRSQDSLNLSNRPKPPGSVISSPLLPSQTQRSDPPSTPQAQGKEALLSPKADRPSTLSRRSMARLTPGPLMSPLSSSLSAVVADSLRKGVDSPLRKRPRLSGARTSVTQRSTGAPSRDEAVMPPSP